jgi:hypothetical protein
LSLRSNAAIRSCAGLGRGAALLATLALCAYSARAAQGQSSHDAHEAPKPTRPPAAVRGPQAPFSSYPTPHLDARGRLWLAFVEGEFVYVASSADRGKTFEPAVRVNALPERIDANGENRPKIAATRDGTLLVSWTQRLAKPHAGLIRFSRSTDRGRSFSAPVTLNDDGLVTGHRFDALGVGPTGDVVVAWIDKRDRERALKQGRKYAGAGLYYTVSRDGGASFAANRKVKDGVCECCRLALGFDSQGVPVLLWRDILPGGVRDHSLVRLTPTVGAPTRATFDDWKIEACPHHGPALSIAADGTQSLAWFTGDGRNGGGVFYARSSDAGKSFSKPIRFADAELGSHPTVLSLGSDVYLAWKQSGSGTSVMLAASQDGGASWSDPRVLARTKHGSDHPLLVSDRREVLLSWFSADEGYRLIPTSEPAVSAREQRPAP